MTLSKSLKRWVRFCVTGGFQVNQQATLVWDKNEYIIRYESVK